jgi:hypothetical protein
MESDAHRQDDEIRMGSEYSTARDYLAREPRRPSAKARPHDPVRRGANDSDFGFQKMGGD